MLGLIATVLISLGGHLGSASVDRAVSVVLEHGGGYLLKEGLVDDAVAQAHFSDHYLKTGWNYLEVRTNASYPDDVQAYGAGLAEAELTRDLVVLQWKNTVSGYCQWQGSKMCARLRRFIEVNNKYVEEMVVGLRDIDPYWHQVGLVYEHLKGFTDGVKLNITIPGDPGILWLNIAGDLEDLENALRPEEDLLEHPRLQSFERVLGGGHCSALVKLVDGHSELFTSHVTWTSYQSMLRIQKRYMFGFHLTASDRSSIIPGSVSTFSSYPGILGSQDDFYIMSSGLVAQETTIGNNNNKLWKYVSPRNSVLEWVRSRVANVLAKDGNQWAKIFSQYNSGTYNNQWMVVDYKRFKKHARTYTEAVLPGLLTVLEQIPGLVKYDDVTPLLRKQSYWPSYNSPYFSEVFNRSGIEPLVEKFGEWFSYDRTPRALIFRRDHSHVHDIESMTRLMRYNDFRHDPLSACNCTPPYSGENSIAARCDLNPVTGRYPFAALGHRNHGATDMKVTSDDMMDRMEFRAVAGPTYDNLPAFRWSTSGFSETPHHGHPDLFKFKPVQRTWRWHSHI